MTSLETSSPTVPPEGPHPARVRLTSRSGDRLDGGWWPRSRDPVTEVVSLLVALSASTGAGAPVVHAALAWEDWDHPDPLGAPAAEVSLGTGVRIGWSVEERHVAVLTSGDGDTLCLLVVPPDFTRGQGAEALLAAATAGNEHSAADLLDEVTDQFDVDPLNHWSDDGGA